MADVPGVPTAEDREEIRDGLESAPVALVDLFRGTNMGKLVVRVADSDPEVAVSSGNRDREAGDHVRSDE